MTREHIEIILLVVFVILFAVSRYRISILKPEIEFLEHNKKYIVERGNILIENLETKIKAEKQVNSGFNERRLKYESEIKTLKDERLELLQKVYRLTKREKELIDRNILLLEMYEQLKN